MYIAISRPYPGVGTNVPSATRGQKQFPCFNPEVLPSSRAPLEGSYVVLAAISEAMP
jgi:hypothetical protein